MSSRWDQRFFASTRGQIVALLRRTTRTVTEMAAALGLTDNAVRAHLATLERDGMVESRPIRKGVGKPALAYDLTPEADRFFPKAYEPVLGELLGALAERLPPAELDAVLRATAQRLAAGRASAAGTLPERVQAAADALEELGGVARVESADGAHRIRGQSCPLAAAVPEHPELCQMAAVLVSEIAGAPARACCDVGDRPRCCFEVASAGD
jgi:predicted ArsR family transcriptional regulator